jgi:small subunit ribosomal protein S21
VRQRRRAARPRPWLQTSSQNGADPAVFLCANGNAGFLCAGVGLSGHPGIGKEVNRLATVILKDGESQENLLKRFRKQVMKERILSDARRKRWYISPSEMRRIQKQRAIRRARRRLRQREARMRTR